MYINIELQEELTIGKLREIVTTGKLSKFPNNTPIKMCINLNITNVDNPNNEPFSPILSIIGDEDSINFYNYI